MEFRDLTVLFVLSLTSLAVIYDIGIYFFNNEKGDTISEVLRDWGEICQTIPVVWMILAGHFWGHMVLPGSQVLKDPWGFVILAAYAGAWGAVRLIWAKTLNRRWVQGAIIMGAFPLAYYCWSVGPMG